MKFFHTADWHLGKLVQGVYMTEDQACILAQFTEAVEKEQPDAVIIAGDLYDRAVPPVEAVHLLDQTLAKIVLDLKIPVLAIAGNHDSPSRLHFGSNIMKNNGLHIIGQLEKDPQPIKLSDTYGDVHFHLIPYCDPSVVRHVYNDETIRNHNDAMKAITTNIVENLDHTARHVFVGHAFVTPFGEAEENTSDSERPLSIGGAEHVDAHLFQNFHYTALGHLHQAHQALQENIRYSGSLLKYSISEEFHKKGYYIVEMDGEGHTEIEKRLLSPRRDIRTVEATIDELLTHPVNEDYVVVKLLDETPVLSPMEKIRAVYPNALHVERKNYFFTPAGVEEGEQKKRTQMNDLDLFKAFYKEVKGQAATSETEAIFSEVLEEMNQADSETSIPSKEKVSVNH
ncbi:exonuclease SbcCD subunit D [Virgibacillus halophilus]|uniref:Nuclease SbcCD subunit D n=1 Tax=Tigheibacillus halophilus TaxID=361280 RepID=A0ABU5C967_9BACI|nr:exonuclease SbcCD subunit D [Virgibacillus halophilus]